MGIFEIIIIGIALSMDAFAVCLSSAVIFPCIGKRKQFLMPITFGLFQGLMPIIGYFFGGLFGTVIEKYGGIVACIILVFIGINMIRECSCEEECEVKNFTLAVLILQAVSTSIDACATGVTFAAVGMNILNAIYASLIIAAITFILCVIAVILGNKLGDKLGKLGGICGGVVLILIGIKSLF